MLKMTTTSVKNNLKVILDQLSSVYNEASPLTRAPNIPRLVAVSKTKPKELVIEAYESGQRHFGENYVQELVDKSSDPVIIDKCPDIKWHFIGTIQSNKVGKIVKTVNLDLVETISSMKLVERFQHNCLLNKVSKLGIMIQVYLHKLIYAFELFFKNGTNFSIDFDYNIG